MNVRPWLLAVSITVANVAAGYGLYLTQENSARIDLSVKDSLEHRAFSQMMYNQCGEAFGYVAAEIQKMKAADGILLDRINKNEGYISKIIEIEGGE